MKNKNLKANFIMSGGVISAGILRLWGLGWVPSLILGFGFAIIIWLGIEEIFS